jgi:type I restriction enzyme M protein
LSDWESINLNGDKKLERSYRESFDVVITNPPFGSQGKIVNQAQLAKFQFGYKWDEKVINNEIKFVRTNEILNGQVPEILFIERCIDFLKPGGRMAIVLPNGDFENTTLRHLRYFILDKCNLLSIIQLPQETFIPSGTGVKTSVLFLTKKINNKCASQDQIFFSQVTKLGYAGNKNGTPIYKKDDKGNLLLDSDGNNLVDEDISEVIVSYGNSRKKITSFNENSFVVKANQIVFDRFDYEFYRPQHELLIQEIIKKNGIPLGKIVKFVKGKPSVLKKKDEIVRYIELSDISNQYSEIINSTELSVHELPSRATYMIQKGHLITSVSGASIGTERHASAYVTEDYDGCICSNGFRVFEVDDKIVDPFYLLAFFKSNYFLNQVFRYRTGAAIPSIIDSDLLKVLIILPSLKDQQRVGMIVKKGFHNRSEYRKELQNNLNF